MVGRCDKHGHFGCAAYECQRAETARYGGGQTVRPATQLDDADGSDATTDSPAGDSSGE